ncbi:nicastrin isoform X2 isoform A [Chlorella sorokiniana]|uniref:Nicastrin n=1 Tax=Chlorella sorokiniana TaxID=3076 RepID=A0A2P6TUI1_CHLSO|nr:nicastrin isoform X2 isoform A [Chlorella sorokiniana]|eukprot:PRW57704.1 nicastrin isoform X2 isoform A [Chlorella sorokiniana]
MRRQPQSSRSTGRATPVAAAAAGATMRGLLRRALCCLAALAVLVPAVQAQSQITNVKDLKAAVYTEMTFTGGSGGGDACVRLLNASGTIGCATPSRQRVEGRLQRLDTLLPSPDDYPDGTTFLLPPALLAGFLQQCAASPSLASRVVGVLVEPQPPPSYSQAAQAPLAELALYADRSYPWNPTGSGLIGMALPFPVFLLDNVTTANAQQRAAYNADQGMNSDLALNYARMTLTMDATGNSSACLDAQSCLPLGGHSVLATLPPLPPPANSSGAPAGAPTAAAAADLPALWVLAQVDTAGLFHEAAVGADAPVSGLIAMLAAAEALGSGNASDAMAAAGARYQRRLVFAALAGEPWGLMGSKRLLWELSTAPSNSSLAGLGLTNASLDGVLEVNQVGRARQPSGTVQLFAHGPAGGPPADFLAALQAAAANSSQGGGPASVSVAAASAATPGLPPTASAGSFLRVGGPSVPTVLLSGFNEAFQGSTFHTQYDALKTIYADSIAATAVVLARTAHALALGGGGAAAPAVPLPIDYAAVRVTVDALMQCLLNSTVGLNCPLAKRLMTPTAGGKVSHYIGILRTLTADPQMPEGNVKSDVERFLWNFLAFATAPTPANTSSSSGSSSGGGAAGGGGGDAGGMLRCQALNATACPAGMVCAGSRSLPAPEGLGYCLNASALFVPSYSLALRCDACDGAKTLYDYRWKAANETAAWEQQYGWPPDPMWMESNWPLGTPALTLYLKEAPATGWALLASGLAVTAASIAVTLGIQWAHRRKLKQH